MNEMLNRYFGLLLESIEDEIVSERKQKERVLDHLTEALNAAGQDVEYMKLSEDEAYVEIRYESGYRTGICVAMDSPEALIKDVMRYTIMKDYRRCID